MGKKESSEVRMLGVIPSKGADPIPVGKIPDGGTQVVKSDEIADTSAILHTVTTGKTLYLSHFTLCATRHVAASGFLAVRDGNDSQVYVISYVQSYTSTQGMAVSGSFLPPLEIPAGYDVYLVSSDAGLFVNGFIHGYEM